MVKKLEQLAKIFDGNPDLVKRIRKAGQYEQFRADIKKVDNNRFNNHVLYGSKVGRIQDAFYEFFQLYSIPDSKRKKALNNIVEVQKLEKNSKEYINDLIKLTRDYDLFISGNKMGLMDESEDLGNLKYSLNKIRHKYSKLRNDGDSWEEQNSLEREIHELKKDVSKRSKRVKSISHDISLVEGELFNARKGISEISDFVSKAKEIKDFYHSYFVGSIMQMKRISEYLELANGFLKDDVDNPQFNLKAEIKKIRSFKI